MNLSRARLLVPAWIACLLVTGCALTHLDLNGGAHVVSTRVTDSDIKMLIDDTHPLTLTLVYDDGYEEVAPQNSVTWSLDIPAIAAIDGNAQLRGRSRGTATLTGAYGGLTATGAIEISDLPQQLEIQASKRNCAVGQQLPYGALLRYQHGSTEDVSARATWTSDQPGVANVDGGGMVTGRGVGDTQIRASFASLVSNADVHISTAIAVHVDVTPVTTQVGIGFSTALRAMATYSDGNTVDGTKLVQWQSTLPAVASVASDGTVRGISTGKVTITAARDGVSGTANITVVVPAGN